MFTKEELEGKSKEEVLDIAEQQEEQIAQIQGYFSGLTRQRLSCIGKDKLVKAVLRNQVTFNL